MRTNARSRILFGACALFWGCSDDGAASESAASASTGQPAAPTTTAEAATSGSSTAADNTSTSGPTEASTRGDSSGTEPDDTDDDMEDDSGDSTGTQVDEEDCVFEPGIAVELQSVGNTTWERPSIARDRTGLWIAYARLIEDDISPYHDVRIGHVSCGAITFDQPPMLFAHEDYLDHQDPVLAVRGDSVLVTYATEVDFGPQQSDYAVFDRESLEILGGASDAFRNSHSGRVDAVPYADGFRIAGDGADSESFVRAQDLTLDGSPAGEPRGQTAGDNPDRFFSGATVSAGGRWLAYTDRDQALDITTRVLHDLDGDVASPLDWRSQDDLQRLQLRTREDAEDFPVLLASFNVGDWPWDETLSDVEVRVGLGEPVRLGLDGRGERGGHLALGPEGRVGVSYYIAPEDGGAAPVMFQELRREGDVLTPVGDEVEVGMMTAFTRPTAAWTGEGFTVVWRRGSSLWMRTVATEIGR